MFNKTTIYRVHVKGTIPDEDGEFIHTYDCNRKPESMDEVAKIAGEFSSLRKVEIEEVVTTVRKNLIRLEK